MAHAHLFEFEDLSWYPRVLREGTTLYLETVERIFGVHRLFAPKLRRAFEQTGTRRLVDMGSGGGGPVRPTIAMVERDLDCTVEVTLTDLHPNERAAAAIEKLGSDSLRYLRESVDASNPPPGLRGVRSMFAFFHHLRPEPAREVLASAYRSGEAICIFEITDPTPVGILSCIMMPIYVLLLTPFVRPISVWQIVLTYVVPVLPFLIAWDGFVSTLRTYTAKELEQMTSDLRDDTYEWEIGTISHPVLPIRFPYALGLPRLE